MVWFGVFFIRVSQFVLMSSPPVLHSSKFSYKGESLCRWSYSLYFLNNCQKFSVEFICGHASCIWTRKDTDIIFCHESRDCLDFAAMYLMLHETKFPLGNPSLWRKLGFKDFSILVQLYNTLCNI